MSTFTGESIQKRLNLFNAGLKVDGVIGPRTKFWIYGIQNSSKDLINDGVYGPLTNKYVMSIAGNRHINTKHFHQQEFNCHCCSKNPGIHINVLILLEAIRYNKPFVIAITSGYRCEKHNAEVGGAKNSQHLFANAADIVMSGATAKSIYQIADFYNTLGGVGSYKTFIHVDCRGYKSRW